MNMRPDWVIIGIPSTDGYVHVYGSIHMDAAELEAKVHHASGWPPRLDGSRVPGLTEYTLKATMASIVWAEGKTYGEALQNLFAFWTPEDQRDERSRPALEPPIRELPDPDG